RNPKPETRNPKPESRNPKPESRKPKPGTRNPKPGTRNPKPETRNPKPGTRNPKPETRNQVAEKVGVPVSYAEELRHPNPQPPHSEPETRNRKPPRQSLGRGRQKSIPPRGSGCQKPTTAFRRGSKKSTPSCTLAWQVAHKVGVPAARFRVSASARSGL
ncbi:hypothetical protein T484DRAFT_1641707, partial [Baffinella frigidus]